MKRVDALLFGLLVLFGSVMVTGHGRPVAPGSAAPSATAATAVIQTHPPFAPAGAEFLLQVR